MQTVLIVLQLFVSIALIVVVLLQKSEGGALVMGGSGSGLGGLFSPRGAADTLTRATTILGVLFFLTSVSLTILSQRGGNARPASILDLRRLLHLPRRLLRPHLPKHRQRLRSRSLTKAVRFQQLPAYSSDLG